MPGYGFRLLCVGLFSFSLSLPAAISDETFSVRHAGAEPEAIHNKLKKAEHKHVPEVKHSIVVNAKAEHVWTAIQHNRKLDDHRKLISYDGSAATLHETFASLPIVGAASCVYVENESTPGERIDYSMVSSERFAVFQGTWLLSPGKNPNETVVELSNAIDPGIRVPFWQDITKMAASKMVKRRLDAISTYAEQLQRNDKTAIR